MLIKQQGPSGVTGPPGKQGITGVQGPPGKTGIQVCVANIHKRRVATNVPIVLNSYFVSRERMA